MKKIIALTDYKNRFGSKHFDMPYRSGMDKSILKHHFEKYNYKIEFLKFTELLQMNDFDKDTYYLYTSSEDYNYYYKSFIEDVVLFLQEIGCKVIPDYKYLRANNNKVFMELMRLATKDEALLSIRSSVYGTKEEALYHSSNLKFPVVIKKAQGASGKGVYKADNINEYVQVINKVSSTKNFIKDFKEILRMIIHDGYVKESKNRAKFIVQNMIEGLKNDWKVYFFGDKLYVFYRPILKHRGFRASGGGYNNYFYGDKANIAPGLFNFVESVMRYFNVPHASLDIAFDGKFFHLIEIQFIYFGTAGIPYSEGYFSKINNEWTFINSKLSIEEVYVQSIVRYIENSIL